jgi:hypothetical protein
MLRRIAMKFVFVIYDNEQETNNIYEYLII